MKVDVGAIFVDFPALVTLSPHGMKYIKTTISSHHRRKCILLGPCCISCAFHAYYATFWFTTANASRLHHHIYYIREFSNEVSCSKLTNPCYGSSRKNSFDFFLSSSSDSTNLENRFTVVLLVLCCLKCHGIMLDLF